MMAFSGRNIYLIREPAYCYTVSTVLLRRLFPLLRHKYGSYQLGIIRISGLHNVQTPISPSKAQWLLYVPPGLTFSNSTFCPHSVLTCFVWISEQSAIISLYSVNWLVFITETECLLRGTDCSPLKPSGYCTYRQV
jgi:hypothetical protein